MMHDSKLYGIFGGTFDPIHNGHLRSLRHVIQLTTLRQVYVLPAAVPPHRPPTCASAERRLEMVKIALGNDDTIRADDRELRRDAPSYTFDTVKSFREQFPDGMPCLILGTDAALGLTEWYRWEALLDLCHLIIMRRPGWNTPETLPEWWQTRLTTLPLSALGQPAVISLDIEPTDLSATQIRQRLGKGQTVSEDLPPGVADYIRTHKLYGSL